jgi:hypothetical protein
MLDAVRSSRFNPDNTRSGLIDLRDPDADGDQTSAAASSLARSTRAEVRSVVPENDWYRAVDNLVAEGRPDDVDNPDHPPTSPTPSDPEDVDGVEQMTLLAGPCTCTR